MALSGATGNEIHATIVPDSGLPDSDHLVTVDIRRSGIRGKDRSARGGLSCSANTSKSGESGSRYSAARFKRRRCRIAGEPPPDALECACRWNCVIERDSL